MAKIEIMLLRPHPYRIKFTEKNGEPNGSKSDFSGKIDESIVKNILY